METIYFDASIIAGLLLISSFFSGSETALMAASRAKLHNMEKAGNKAAIRVIGLIKSPETLLSTILLGNNLVNILASALAARLFMNLFGEVGIAYATAVMTVVVLIFGEVLPKTIAAHWPERFAMIISLPMVILSRVLAPFTYVIRKITRAVMRLMGMNVNQADPNFGEEDLRGAIGLSLSYGVLEKPEHRMLDSILELDELTVEDIMTHRSAIESIDIGQPLDKIQKQLMRSVHSRLPIWEDTPDNVIGILHIRDFYRALNSGAEVDLRQVMQQPYFVPEQAIVSEQLMAFRKHRKHMGLVVDEYGDIMGLVTLEDILEEIVGEIEDEHDVVRSWYTRQPDGTITVSGAFPVRDANREFDWELPDDESVSLGGLLVEEAERIPAVGEKIRIGNLEFEVLARRRQAISRIAVRANQPITEAETTNKNDNREAS